MAAVVSCSPHSVKVQDCLYGKERERKKKKNEGNCIKNLTFICFCYLCFFFYLSIYLFVLGCLLIVIEMIHYTEHLHINKTKIIISIL